MYSFTFRKIFYQTVLTKRNRMQLYGIRGYFFSFMYSILNNERGIIIIIMLSQKFSLIYYSAKVTKVFQKFVNSLHVSYIVLLFIILIQIILQRSEINLLDSELPYYTNKNCLSAYISRHRRSLKKNSYFYTDNLITNELLKIYNRRINTQCDLNKLW